MDNVPLEDITTEPIADECSMDTDLCYAVSDDEHRSSDDDFSMDQDLGCAENDEEHSAQEYEPPRGLYTSMVCIDNY